MSAPAASWPQPWGMLTTPGMMPSVTSTGISTSPTRDRTRRRRAVDEAEPGGVVGVDLERAARLALHQDLDVVHPRVVRAQVAPADEHDLAVGAAVERRHAGAPRRRRRSPRARARSCPTASAAPRAGAAGADRGRRRAGSPRAPRATARPRGRAPNPSPYGPVRSMRSSTPLGPAAAVRRERRRSARRRRGPRSAMPLARDRLLHHGSGATKSSSAIAASALRALPGHDAASRSSDLPLGHLVAGCSSTTGGE